MSRFIAPVSDRVSQQFGDNPDYYRPLGQNGHTGIDYACWTGTPVRASGDGVVAFEGWGQNHGGFLKAAGIAVLVDHGDVYTGYAHLSSTTVNVGQRVKQGDIIGYSGATGQVVGPHLHFEFWGKPTNWKNGWAGRVNPNNYLGKGDEGMRIGPEENWRARMNRLHHQLVRNGDMSDAVFRNIVGQDAWSVVENWSDHPEAGTLIHYQTVGEVATRDDWPGQIYRLQDQVAALSKRPSDAQLAELNAQLVTLQQSVEQATAQAEQVKAEAEVVAAENAKLEAQAEADKQAGDTLLRRIGQLVTKYLPGSK